MSQTPSVASTKLDTARRSLRNARRYLETGKAVNWACGDIRAGLLWAAEAWLLKNGHQIKSAAWIDLQCQFIETAPQPLRSRFTNCLVGIISLDSNGEHENWKESIWKCLEEAEEILLMIQETEP